MTIYLVTGAAGFIASRICGMLIESGHRVIGIDNLNEAYDVRVKHWRLEKLKKLEGFTFYQEGISEHWQRSAKRINPLPRSSIWRRGPA
jgi:UDP-glucuronate 4-epimerase